MTFNDVSSLTETEHWSEDFHLILLFLFLVTERLGTWLGSGFQLASLC